MTNFDFPPGPSLAAALATAFKAKWKILPFLSRIAADYKGLIYFRFLGRHNYLVTQPADIEKVMLSGYKVGRSRPQPLRKALGNGLICSQGSFHQKMRHMMQPYFHPENIAKMAPMMAACARDKAAEWKDGETRDIEKEMVELTLRVILKSLLGEDLGDQMKAFGRAADVVHRNGNATPMAILNTALERIPFLGPRMPLGRARKYLNDQLFGLIEERRKTGDLDKADFLSLFLKIQKTEEGQKFLTDKQIRDEILTMLTAGHETIASALTWTWYLLSQHPQVEERFHEELERVLGSREPSAGDVSRLPYAVQIFSETMRLYPPVWASARRPVEPIEVGGYTIKTGSCLYITQYLTHRDPRYWPDPERFDPDRFAPGQQEGRPKYAYFPFGGGNRQCIGERFAWQEALLLMAVIGQRWRFRLEPGHSVEADPLIALQPRCGMRMKLEARAGALAGVKEGRAHGNV